EQVDDLAAGQVGPQRHVAWHVSESAMQFGGVAPRVTVEEAGGARVGTQQPQEYPDRGGLAGSVGPEEAVHFAGADGQIETVERAGPPERLVQAGHRDCVSHTSEGTLLSQTREAWKAS